MNDFIESQIMLKIKNLKELIVGEIKLFERRKKES
jgi:hypothetical protein